MIASVVPPPGWHRCAAPTYRQPVSWAKNYRVYSHAPLGPPLDWVPIFSVSGKPHDFEAMKRDGYRTFLTWQTARDAPHIGARCTAAGVKFFRIPVRDESAPTQEQAEDFLRIVGNPDNWPLHTACAAGEHRSSLGGCLVRVTFDLWTVDEALEEAERFDVWHFGFSPGFIRHFTGSPLSKAQEAFLRNWRVK